MKKVLLIIAIFVGIIQGIAQEVTVHVDGQSLVTRSNEDATDEGSDGKFQYNLEYSIVSR